MRHEFPRAPGAQKPKCKACGHLLEKHTHLGRCTAKREVSKHNEPSCPCRAGIAYRKGAKHVRHGHRSGRADV